MITDNGVTVDMNSIRHMDGKNYYPRLRCQVTELLRIETHGSVSWSCITAPESDMSTSYARLAPARLEAPARPEAPAPAVVLCTQQGHAAETFRQHNGEYKEIRFPGGGRLVGGCIYIFLRGVWYYMPTVTPADTTHSPYPTDTFFCLPPSTKPARQSYWLYVY